MSRQPCISDLSSKWTILLGLLADLGSEWDFSKTQRGEVLHVFMIATCADARRCGVAKRLLAANIELAKRLGYRRSIIEATGRFSQALAASEGYTEDKCITYSDWVYAPTGTRPYDNLQLDHPSVLGMSLTL